MVQISESDTVIEIEEKAKIEDTNKAPQVVSEEDDEQKSFVEKFKEFIATFTPYLEDARKRLYLVTLCFAIAFVIGFLMTSTLLRLILSLFVIDDVVIATTSPFQFADLSINTGLFVAFLISCPLAVYHFFMFLRPALTKKERLVFFTMIPLTVGLFAAGFLYGFAMMYYGLLILARINTVIGIKNIWDIGIFLSQIMLTATLLGMLFQFPTICTLAIRSGFFTAQFLKEKRRIAVLIIFLFVSLLPPTDGLSLIAMALPLILLYEVTIFINRRVGRVDLLLIQ